jgi:RNA polymerase sigma-70 factor (ECF subfamily)
MNNQNHKTEAIWIEFSDQLKSFILRRVSNPFDVDDILQEVFLKIHSKINTLKDNAKLNSWIYRVTRNTIVDFYRKRKAYTSDIEIIDNIPEEAEDNYNHKIAEGLKTMILALPEKYAQALLLTEFDGLTQKELSQKLGMSISGVKSRVQRARKMLKDHLMHCCHFEFDRYGTIIDYHPIECCCCHKN